MNWTKDPILRRLDVEELDFYRDGMLPIDGYAIRPNLNALDQDMRLIYLYPNGDIWIAYQAGRSPTQLMAWAVYLLDKEAEERDLTTRLFLNPLRSLPLGREYRVPPRRWFEDGGTVPVQWHTQPELQCSTPQR